MGLGKTLTMLALVLATKLDIPVDHSNTTLIGESFILLALLISLTQMPSVVPLSVMSNWEKQIEDHVQPGGLTSCVYYGKTRDMSPTELKRYDVVITTYQTVVQDHELSFVGKAGTPAAKRQKTDKGLFDVAWKVSGLCADT